MTETKKNNFNLIAAHCICHPGIDSVLFLQRHGKDIRNLQRIYPDQPAPHGSIYSPRRRTVYGQTRQDRNRTDSQRSGSPGFSVAVRFFPRIRSPFLFRIRLLLQLLLGILLRLSFQSVLYAARPHRALRLSVHVRRNPYAFLPAIFRRRKAVQKISGTFRQS